MEIELLNHVRVTINGKAVALGDRKQRLMVGVLAAHGGVVEKGTLFRLLWEPDQEPQGADGQLYTYAKGIRTAFDLACPGARELLTTERNRGYRLEFEKGNVDYYRFLALKREAETTAGENAAEAARLGRLALAEWGAHAGVRGGTPLGGFEPQIENYTESWRQDYQSALVNCLRAELACGWHEQVLPELTRLAEHDDYGKANEDISRMRMLAYYRVGWRLRALDVYNRLYAELKNAGFLPSPETLKLQEMIMNQDPALDLPKNLPKVGEGSADEPAVTPEQPPVEQDVPKSRTSTFGDTHISGTGARIIQLGSLTNYYEKPDD